MAKRDPLAGIAQQKGFMEHAQTLHKLFAAADKTELEKAFREGDWSAVCRALRVDEKALTGFLESGASLAKMVQTDFPELTNAAVAMKRRKDA